MYWFGDRRIDNWQSRLVPAVRRTSPQFHASRIFRVGIHVLSTLLAITIVLVYF